MAYTITHRQFRLRHFSVAVLSLVLLISSNVRADITTPTTSEWIKASTVTASSLALAFGLRFVSTPQCYWCNTNSFDVNIGRSWAVENIEAARLSSDLITFGLVPLMAATSVTLSSSGLSQAFRDVLVIMASAASTIALSEAIKISARRTRPEVVFGISSGGDQDNRSFLSGHTSFAFSILTSTSVLALKRGHRWAPYFTGVSALAGVAVGYSRIAAAKHWATDVLAGMTLGIGMGALMPLFILSQEENEGSASAFYLLPDFQRTGVQVGMAW